MKRYLSGLGIAAMLFMCAYPSCESEESQKNSGHHTSVDVVAETPGDVNSLDNAKDAGGHEVDGEKPSAAQDAAATAEAHGEPVAGAVVQAAEEIVSPLRVVIKGDGSTKEQAVALAKKKAVTRAIQYLQEENSGQEYKSEVFALCYRYDRFVLACNVRIKEATADNVSVEVRVDINRKALAEAMKEYI